MSVDIEDVSPEVSAATLGVAVRYEVLVEGGSTANISPARRLARGLTAALGGAVLDAQTGEVWSPKTGRVVARPQRDERVAVIDVDWCFAKNVVRESTVHGFLALCRRYLPEALPRRFGDVEPMQERYEQVGEQGFVRFWSAGTDVFWSARLPCTGGTLYDPPGQYEEPGWKLSLDFLCEPFASDPAWRATLRTLFVAVADELGAFYASAQVTDQYIWSSGGLCSDAATETPTYVGGHWWRGLPTHPVWWSWYGPEYTPIVADLLAADAVMRSERGIFHACSEVPRTRYELEADRIPWLPADLTAESTGTPARRIPPTLEVLAGKRSDDDVDYLRHDPAERLRKERRERIAAAEQVVVDELVSAGVIIRSLTDLAIVGEKRIRQPAAIRVLATQLDKDLPQHVKEDVVFYLSLARSAAAEAWPILREQYLRCEPDSEFKRRLGDALAATVTKPRLPELIDLVSDARHGATRRRMLTALKRFKDDDAIETLRQLRDDPELGPDARRLTS